MKKLTVKGTYQREQITIKRLLFVIVYCIAWIVLVLLDIDTTLPVKPAYASENETEVSEVEDYIVPEGSYVLEPLEVVREDASIDKFVSWYPGSRITKEYLEVIKSNCTPEDAKRLVAMSVAETGQGRDVSWMESNFFGWFPGGNRSYDPGYDQMSKDICNGLQDRYKNIPSDNAVAWYIWGMDYVDTTSDMKVSIAKWQDRYNWAISQM